MAKKTTKLDKPTKTNKPNQPTETPQNANEDKPFDTYYPLINAVFQKWMGDKEICSKFLSALLGREINVVSITVEHEESEFAAGLRGVRLDIEAIDERFEIYDIDAQQQFFINHKDRCLIYTCRLVSTQLKPGDDFGKLKRVTVIFINLKNDEGEDFVDDAGLRYSKKPHKVYNEKIRIIDVNLDKLKGAEGKIDKKLEYFALFCLLGDRPDVFERACQERGLNFPDETEKLNELFKLIKGDYTVADHINKNKEQYQFIDKNVKEALPMMHFLDRMEMEAKERGVEEGMEKNKEEAAMKMFELGLDTETVLKVTGLSLEKLNRIRGEALA
jgi:predicted transposase/invertase (TIGR01784 family)